MKTLSHEFLLFIESGFITKAFVDQYIDKIFATPEADGTVRLDIRIFTGEATEKYLETQRLHTNKSVSHFCHEGHTASPLWQKSA